MPVKTVSIIDQNGKYLGPSVAQESPVRPGTWLMPRSAVDAAPPEYNPTAEDAYWTGEEWEVRPRMTQTERYRQGIDPIPKGMVLEGDGLRPMTNAELVAAGLITQEEAKASLVAEVHALREERFRRGFVHTDGHRYPLDLGAQTAFLGIDALVAKSIPVPINILTVDNQVVPMTAEEFSVFSLAAFAAGNEIVFRAREAKDRVLAAETIEAAEAVAEAYREG